MNKNPPRLFENHFCAERGWHAFQHMECHGGRVPFQLRHRLLQHLELRRYLRDGVELFVAAGLGTAAEVRTLANLPCPECTGDLFETDLIRLVSWTRGFPSYSELRKRHFPSEKRAWIDIEVNRGVRAHNLMYRIARKESRDIAERLVDALLASGTPLAAHSRPKSFCPPCGDLGTFLGWMRNSALLLRDWDSLSNSEVEERFIDLCCYDCVQTGQVDTRSTYRPHRNVVPDELTSKALQLTSSECLFRAERVHARMHRVWKELMNPDELKLALTGGYLRTPEPWRETRPIFGDKLPGYEPEKFPTLTKALRDSAKCSPVVDARNDAILMTARCVRAFFRAKNQRIRHETMLELDRLRTCDSNGRTKLARIIESGLAKPGAFSGVRREVKLALERWLYWVLEPDPARDRMARLSALLSVIRDGSPALSRMLSMPHDVFDLSIHDAPDSVSALLDPVLNHAKSVIHSNTLPHA